ncbi:hypothetical protein FHS18_001855 [Paenibacillus phyllosphaerae]|uniref:Uncharacterized protein n=1 Tax=Paenibacillus phyllosphaerae TaxID=274593 RepID=A0A7W5AW71_9BACL|nr:hypothetical protein [Paenibacillus phyllosphaerae]MBB3109792.1 hypothetical protein [Paenibacillus phyllosphaerae]
MSVQSNFHPEAEAPIIELSQLVGDAQIRDLFQGMKLLSKQELEELRDSLEIMALHTY